MWLTGPGFFTVNEPAQEQLFIDYRSIPDDKFEKWPEMKPNEKGISKLVYAGMQDYMRKVSDRVTVGDAWKNGKKMNDYFFRPVLQMQLNFVFDITERKDQFDVIATVKGGGLSGQAGAVRHGLSRALSLFEPELRKPLKTAGMLTRDSRVVERKKPGQKKARKKFQWVKR